MLFDQADAFNRFDGAADVVLIACGAGEHQRIEDDIFRRDGVFFREQFQGTLGDFEFAFAREGLRLRGIFVNTAHHHRRAVGTRERADALEFLLAIFQVDRIDDAFALAIGERELDGIRVRGIDHDRDFDFANELVVEGLNVLHFFAVGALQADVHDMRAAFHLPPRDFGGFFPLLGGDKILEEARADYVGALADDQRTSAVFRLDDFDPGINRAMIPVGSDGAVFCLRPFARWPECVFRWFRSIRRRYSASRDRRSARVARQARSASPDSCLPHWAVPHSDSTRQTDSSAIATCECGPS